jgi:hypothetical protein
MAGVVEGQIDRERRHRTEGWCSMYGVLPYGKGNIHSYDRGNQPSISDEVR